MLGLGDLDFALGEVRPELGDFLLRAQTVEPRAFARCLAVAEDFHQRVRWFDCLTNHSASLLCMNELDKCNAQKSFDLADRVIRSRFSGPDR